jgi:hypothetical protein
MPFKPAKAQTYCEFKKIQIQLLVEETGGKFNF